MHRKIRRKIKADYKAFKKNWRSMAKTVGFILVIYAIVFSLLYLWHRENIKDLEKVPDPAISHKASAPAPAPVPSPKPTSSWLSFGDSFSSNAYLDSGETTMFLDEKMTALIFPPIYDFQKTEKCSDHSCGLSEPVMMDSSSQQKPDHIPPALVKENIVSSSLHKLSSKYIASFIVLENGQENVYAYFFDGNKFSAIVTNSSDVKMKTKYGRGGGRVAVGGNDDNFVLIYNGYEGMGIHYYNGEVFDISKFLGLRVSDSGFPPYIIKQGEGRKSVWYILSLNSAKPRLIKLWQNNSEEIVGGHDFSYIFKDSSDKLVAFKSSYKRGELEFLFSSESNEYYLKTFVDKGFDNSQSREALSIDINSSLATVTKAVIREIGLNGNADIFLGNTSDNFLQAENGKEVRFKRPNPELFWKIRFPKSGDKDYSPWLEHINYLDYYVQE